MSIVRPKLIYQCSTFIAVVIENRESWDYYKLEEVFSYGYTSYWHNDEDDNKPHVLLYGIPLFGQEPNTQATVFSLSDAVVYKYDKDLWRFTYGDHDGYYECMSKVQLEIDTKFWLLKEKCGHDLTVEQFFTKLSIAFADSELSKLTYDVVLKDLFGRAYEISDFTDNILKHFISLTMKYKYHMNMKIAYLYMYEDMQRYIQKRFGVKKYLIVNTTNTTKYDFTIIRDILWRYYKKYNIVDDFYSSGFDEFIENITMVTLYINFINEPTSKKISNEKFIENFNTCFNIDYSRYLVFCGTHISISEFFRIKQTANLVVHNSECALSKEFIACFMSFIHYIIISDNTEEFIEVENGMQSITLRLSFSRIFQATKELPDLPIKEDIFYSIKPYIEFVWLARFSGLDNVSLARVRETDVYLSGNNSEVVLNLKYK